MRIKIIKEDITYILHSYNHTIKEVWHMATSITVRIPDDEIVRKFRKS